ncbi:hypothetical protein SMMN14_01685, partial [Sphaerulina musiva]
SFHKLCWVGEFVGGCRNNVKHPHRPHRPPETVSFKSSVIRVDSHTARATSATDGGWRLRFEKTRTGGAFNLAAFRNGVSPFPLFLSARRR